MKISFEVRLLYFCVNFNMFMYIGFSDVEKNVYVRQDASSKIRVKLIL